MRENLCSKEKIIFFVIFFLFQISLVFSQDVKIKQENGVTVIYNSIKPVTLPGMPSNLILTEDMRIGVEYGDENYMFSELQSIRVDDDEDIIIFDIKELCIKVFDKNGRFIRDKKFLFASDV